MGHCFVNSLQAAPASWQQALPGAGILARDDVASLGGLASGIVWCRLSAGETVDALLAGIRRHTALPLVLLSDAPGDAEAESAFAAGVSGYCNTHAAPEVLRQVALVVENGGLWLGPSLMQRLVAGTAKLLAGREPGVRERWSDRLSEREQEVAWAVAGGASNKEIADALGITERTVKAHLGAIFEKLGVRDRLQLSLRVNGMPG